MAHCYRRGVNAPTDDGPRRSRLVLAAKWAAGIGLVIAGLLWAHWVSQWPVGWWWTAGRRTSLAGLVAAGTFSPVALLIWVSLFGVPTRYSRRPASAPNGRRRWTQEQDKLLRELHEAGLSNRDIGKRLGRTTTAVRTRLKKAPASP